MNINQTFKLMQSAVAALTLVGGGSFVYVGSAAAVEIASSAAVQGTAGSSGLMGTYEHASPGSTKFDIADTKAQLATAKVSGNFTSTVINYSGRDLSSVVSFLGVDGGSYAGTNGNLSDGIFELTGFLHVTSPSTVQFNLLHDDATELRIGGQVLISANCCGLNGASATFSDSGYYAVDIIYANTAVTDRSGGATFKLSSDTDNQFYQTMTPVPEPETYAMLLAGLGALGFVARRRKSL